MPEEVVLNLTPDTKVLIALTHTDIKPLDALCELMRLIRFLQLSFKE